MVSPFCVAGYLAELTQTTIFKTMVERLPPPSLFGTIRKAFEIMKNVRHDMNVGKAAN
jgi:hypothetical protein